MKQCKECGQDLPEPEWVEVEIDRRRHVMIDGNQDYMYTELPGASFVIERDLGLAFQGWRYAGDDLLCNTPFRWKRTRPAVAPHACAHAVDAVKAGITTIEYPKYACFLRVKENE
jgi:hypothetical protein